MSKKLEEELTFYLDLYDALCMIELNYDRPLIETDTKILMQLADLVHMKRGLKNDLLTEKYHIYNWMLGDRYVPIIIIRHDKDEENNLCNAIYTRNLRTAVSDDEGNYFKVPLFSLIDTHVIKNLYHYDYEWLKEQIDSAEVNEHTVECLNQVALKLISVFDTNKDYKALELAQYQFEKIRELEKDKSYFMINILQLKKRKEDLTEQDIYELKSIVSSDLQISFGVKVLLEDNEGAKLIFEEMDEKTQEFIKAFPIYHLYES